MAQGEALPYLGPAGPRACAETGYLGGGNRVSNMDLDEFLGEHPQGFRKRDLYDSLKVERGRNKPVDRAIKWYVRLGLLRVETVKEGGRTLPYYVPVTAAEREASRVFEEARQGMVKSLREELPPPDAPLEVQAEEMAGLLVGIHNIGGYLAAGWLEAAMRRQVNEEAAGREKGGEPSEEEVEEARDLSAIHWLVGRTDYLNELTIDIMLTVVLARRKAAPRALEIFRAHLEGEVAT